MSESIDTSPRQSQWLDRGLSLVPALFAVPVLGGIGVTLVRLLLTDHAEADFSPTVSDDAAALFLGQPLYQDPDQGYSGIFYTPLFPAIVSLLYRVDVWTGWPLLIAILASLAMVALVARLAYRRRGPARTDRAIAVLEAAGVGALGWALVTGIELSGIYGQNGLHDGVAWAAALAGLALLPAAAGGERNGRLALSVLLLSAAFWTKQVTLVASAVAVVWVGLAAAGGAAGRRPALGFTLGLLGLNALTLGVLNLLTSGWEADANFLVPSEQPLGEWRGVARFLLDDVLPGTALLAGFTATMWLALALRRAPSSRVRDPRRALSAFAGEARARWVLALGSVAVLVGAIAFRLTGSLNLYFLTAPEERPARFIETVLVPAGTLALLFAATLILAVGAKRARSAAKASHHPLRRRARAAGASLARASEEGRFATILVLLLAMDVPLTYYFRRKVGVEDNAYLGIAWALALLGGIGYRFSKDHRSTAAVAGAAVLALFAAMAVVSPTPERSGRLNALALPSLSRVGDGREGGWLTVSFPRLGLVPVKSWAAVAEDLRAYARDHLVYEQNHGALNATSRGMMWPNIDIFLGDVVAGRRPRYLIDALLERRFDAVTYPFRRDKASFASGGELVEDDFLWKLDEVVRAKYRPATGIPAGLYARRPGPDPAPWMRFCFGPFEVAGQSFRINEGGGFWCSPPGQEGRLALVKTRASYSALRTAEPVRALSGSLTARLPAGEGRFRVVVEPADGPPWMLEGTPSETRRRTIAVSVAQAGTASTQLEVPAGRGGSVRLVLARPSGAGPPLAAAAAEGAEVRLPDTEGGAVLRLGATRGSDAVFDLRGLRLEG